MKMIHIDMYVISQFCNTHNQSLQYGYLQKISLDQSHPVVNSSFKTLTGRQVSCLHILTKVPIHMFVSF